MMKRAFSGGGVFFAVDIRYKRNAKRSAGAGDRAGDLDCSLTSHVVSFSPLGGLPFPLRDINAFLRQFRVRGSGEGIGEGWRARTFVRHLFLCDFAGLAEANDVGHVQRAGTHAALVTAAINDGGKLHARIAAADVQSADPLGSINLVSADGQQVDIVFLDVDRKDKIRSEEHTSELQSHLNLVCRLLLEKKKTDMKIFILQHTSHTT